MAAAERVFISYRRDDAAGYAGRLEEALEKRLGHGSVFRDLLDIPPGADFVDTIRQSLSGARTVLVLIGPRWAGEAPGGARRIDDPQDFVRLEVQVALHGGAQVIPVLLPGTRMPAEAELPEPLKALARRNALELGDPHWDADVDRLAAGIDGAPRRARRPLLVGGVLAAVLVAALAAGVAWRSGGGAPADAAARFVGSWQGPVRYAWGDRYDERFEFQRHAGELTGSATFLGYPRAIGRLRVDGGNLHFETHSIERVGDSSKELTHAYAAELRGQPPDEVLAFRLEISGGHSSNPPIAFEARRVPDAAPAAGAPGTPASR
ncbi:toll/interleukin-1 receptor domain-containing protein [Pseudorhodoferax sp.]|uniref:toll/interleukin-1 receptor domain-containing protein n=1 Tax=Pseudorhodoferax sp. TaxID=1993553 RepID=UPI0039E65E0D